MNITPRKKTNVATVALGPVYLGGGSPLALALDDAVTTLAIDLWNAEHNALDGTNRELWDKNMAEGGIPADVQRRYLTLATLAIRGGNVTSRDGRRTYQRAPLIAVDLP